MLAREALYLRGIISRKTPWDVMPDLYFFREPEDTYPTDWNAAAVAPAVDYQPTASADWDAKPDASAATADWGAEITPAPDAAKDWGAEPMPTAKADDWGASTVTPSADWGAQQVAGNTSDWGAADNAPVGWD